MVLVIILKYLNHHILLFSDETVTLVGYKYRSVQPWKGIDKGYIPNWWNVYNAIKHHRDSEKTIRKIISMQIKKIQLKCYAHCMYCLNIGLLKIL